MLRKTCLTATMVAAVAIGTAQPASAQTTGSTASPEVIGSAVITAVPLVAGLHFAAVNAHLIPAPSGYWETLSGLIFSHIRYEPV